MTRELLHETSSLLGRTGLLQARALVGVPRGLDHTHGLRLWIRLCPQGAATPRVIPARPPGRARAARHARAPPSSTADSPLAVHPRRPPARAGRAGAVAPAAPPPTMAARLRRHRPRETAAHRATEPCAGPRPGARRRQPRPASGAPPWPRATAAWQFLYRLPPWLGTARLAAPPADPGVGQPLEGPRASSLGRGAPRHAHHGRRALPLAWACVRARGLGPGGPGLVAALRHPPCAAPDHPPEPAAPGPDALVLPLRHLVGGRGPPKQMSVGPLARRRSAPSNHGFHRVPLVCGQRHPRLCHGRRPCLGARRIATTP